MPTTRPIEEIGPFSSVFPYEQLAQEEEAKRQKLTEGQQKIAKTNTLGEAFRLLVDTIGAPKGATVVPRDLNPGVFRASDRIRQIEDQSNTNLDRLKMIDLQNKQKDVAYGQGLEAEKRDAERRAGEVADQRGWNAEQTTKEQEFRAGQTKQAQEHDVAMEGLRSKNDMAQIYAREAADKKALGQDNAFMRRYRGIYGDTKPYMALPDMELGVDIPLSDTDAMQILKWMRQDPAVSDIDKFNIKPSDLTNNLVFKNLVVANWDRYKGLVRKLGAGETISAQDEKAMIDMGARQKRTTDYQTRRDAIDPTRRKGAKQLEALNTEYADLFTDQQDGQGAAGGFSLKPEEGAKIDGVINAEGWSAEEKRSAVYSYLTKQGYEEAKAKEFAEYVYQNLK